jgi:predicted amidohydrolase YtcJ
MDMVLTAYEKITAGDPNHLRHGIIHCQITDMPILERFRKGEVLALVQPIFLHYDMKIVESRVGKELAETSYAFNTMDKLGVRVSYGTDAPIEDLNTMNNIHCAVNRQDLKGNPKQGFYPQESVSLTRAIDNYTYESAYAAFDENIKGRIASGYLADMCVLDRDIFTIDPSEIISVKVDMTILGGKTVFTRR